MGSVINPKPLVIIEVIKKTEESFKNLTFKIKYDQMQINQNYIYAIN